MLIILGDVDIKNTRNYWLCLKYIVKRLPKVGWTLIESEQVWEDSY